METASYQRFTPQTVSGTVSPDFSWIGRLGEWFQSGLAWLERLWEWMAPGISALAAAAPIAVPIVTLIVAVAALRTFRLRVRVDHAEQWLKRMQDGVQKSLSKDEVEQEYGMRLLATLNASEKPWLFFNPEKDYRLRARQISESLERLFGQILLKTRWMVRVFQFIGWTAQWVVFGFPVKQALAAARTREGKKAGKAATSKALRELAKQNRKMGINDQPAQVTEYPKFRDRLKARKEFRKTRRVTWSVSPAEEKMHRAISELLQNRALGLEDSNEPMSAEDAIEPVSPENSPSQKDLQSDTMEDEEGC